MEKYREIEKIINAIVVESEYFAILKGLISIFALLWIFTKTNCYDLLAILSFLYGYATLLNIKSTKTTLFSVGALICWIAAGVLFTYRWIFV